MTENIKAGDFVQVEYTGHIAEDGTIFDTTDEAVAKKHSIHSERSKYGPVVICIGEHQLIKGIDEELVGKAVGQQYTFTFPPERAFGRKDAKLIQLIPTQKFRKEGIQPMPGLQITVDGMLATVKSVSGGRTLVDFNHPLASREVRYEVNVLKKITDSTGKLRAFLVGAHLGTAEGSVAEGKATVTLPFELPAEMQNELSEKIRKVIPEITAVEFKKGTEKEQIAEKPQQSENNFK